MKSCLTISSSFELPKAKPLPISSYGYAYAIPQTIQHYGYTKTTISQKHTLYNHFQGIRKSEKIMNSIAYCQNRESATERKPSLGIGINNFLQGKNYLITGATGFLAKGQKDKEAASERLKTEIIDSKLFENLEKVYGKSYKAFMTRKLVAVPGNVDAYDLGMDALTTNEIAKKIDVIVHSAANTNFYERYDVALNINTRGPSHLLRFAKSCKRICLFLHISTAYVNDGREGMVKETPLSYMGRSIANIDDEMKMAANAMVSANENEASEAIKTLGLERAKMHGWGNTYSFTKAMGEMLLSSMRVDIDIPIVIIRPTIVESTYKEPFSGWIEGCRTMDPVIISFGKDQLPGIPAKPEVILDVVPADIVVNATIAAMAKHESSSGLDLIIYQVGSSVVNPCSIGDMCEYFYDHFKCYPLLDSKGNEINISRMKFFSSIDDFSSYISSEMLKKSGLMEATTVEPQLYSKLQKQSMKRAQHFIEMAKMYETYMFYKGRFDIANAQKLMEEMSNEEKENFGFDIGRINWKEYICSIHIPGLRKHVLKRELKSRN